MKSRAIISFLFLLTACGDDHRLESKSIDSDSERVSTLSEAIKPFSVFYDAEYVLTNANGFSNFSIPAPDVHVDYEFAIKLKTADLGKWTTGLKRVDTLTNNNFSWKDDILGSRKQNWKTSSAPKYFVRPDENVMMQVYEDEGIIFKRIVIAQN